MCSEAARVVRARIATGKLCRSRWQKRIGNVKPAPAAGQLHSHNSLLSRDCSRDVPLPENRQGG
jgi:hypothetical protein